MTSQPLSSSPAVPAGVSRLLDRWRSRVPALVLGIVLTALLLAVVRVLAYGFIPPDDSMRHVAKVFSGKPWGEILVLRPGLTQDSHPGWHALLGAWHGVAGGSPDTLVAVSVAGLWLLVMGLAACLAARPEGWLLAVGVAGAAALGSSDLLLRFLLGRPLLVSVAVLLLFCFRWQTLCGRRWHWPWAAAFAAAAALSCWIHGSWYLLSLPVAGLLLARQWRGAARLALLTAAGILLGAGLTGQPVAFLAQTWNHLFLSLGQPVPSTSLVTEFQPGRGDTALVLVAALVLLWRQARGRWRWSCIDNPVFYLAALGWLLGLAVVRFWTDWGAPALIAWLALELQPVLIRALPRHAWGRLAVAAGAAGLLLLVLVPDRGGRWTQNLLVERITAADPDQRPWLPGPGGIVYSDNMNIFYETFYENPQGDWKYVLGFEPGWMPADDLRILRDIQRFQGGKCFQPWVRKMRPQDRLILAAGPEAPPSVEGLEWHYAAKNRWSGRPLPAPATGH
ncbi:MAG: hypothetical protein WC708_18155 [Lentisphaeria bacterium]